MIRLILGFFFISQSFASNLQEFRWYLHPNNQKVLISIDDLHDETIIASPLMDWGRNIVAQLTLKKDILIAVIDGGMEIEHPELKDYVAYHSADCYNGTIIPPVGSQDLDNNGYKGDCAGWDFVEDQNRVEDLDGHGTHVAGIITSVIDGMKGHIKLLPLRVFAPGEGTRSVKGVAPLSVRLSKAFHYALEKKVDVIHMSVGWPKSFMSYELEQVIKKALDLGVIIVSAAGNSSQKASIYPCQMDRVICVGALRANGDIARFSNWGTQVDLFAPGEKILSSIPHTLAPLHISRKGYDYKNGTSQAAPFITGALSVLKGQYPDASREELYSRLMLTSDDQATGSGLKGLFHLDRALEVEATSFVFPELKGITGIVLDKEKLFSLKIPFKNFWLAKTSPTNVKVTCPGAEVFLDKSELSPLSFLGGESVVLSGILKDKKEELICVLSFENQKISLRLKVMEKFNEAKNRFIVSQDDLYVINTRNGARSRFLYPSQFKFQLGPSRPV